MRCTRRQFTELPFYFELNLASESGRRGDEKANGVGSVFRLREQIGSDPACIARFGEVVPRPGLIHPTDVKDERIARQEDPANKFGGFV